MPVGDAHVFPGFPAPVLSLLFFPHAFAEVIGENTSERKLAPTRDRTHNHQVMSPTRPPLSHPVGAILSRAFGFQYGTTGLKAVDSWYYS